MLLLKILVAGVGFGLHDSPPFAGGAQIKSRLQLVAGATSTGNYFCFVTRDVVATYFITSTPGLGMVLTTTGVRTRSAAGMHNAPCNCRAVLLPSGAADCKSLLLPAAYG